MASGDAVLSNGRKPNRRLNDGQTFRTAQQSPMTLTFEADFPPPLSPSS
jgi:hypothetical protein